ncbi:class I SAM-dependent methyltransferase [Shouchella shacheensis]|uniref:class I SAM-dependent methyltransferase n=1 Tax=Shouchella shacheensis TaxID=1649580 RepID=UPI00073FC6D1|nr:class I SAM-dependent methyltransferase [Shouchella shacheensis]
MGKWFARLYDVAMSPLEQFKFKKIRKRLLRKSEGRVLEIGSGTGTNFQLYRGGLQVDAIEPDPFMKEISIKQKEKSKVPIRTYLEKAESLPFANDTFDSIIGTLVFCTIEDPGKALKEVKRVCKPGGRVLLFEHVRFDNPVLGRLQDMCTPIWSKVCGGCRLNRNTRERLKNAGFAIDNTEEYFKGLFLVIECVNSKE